MSTNLMLDDELINEARRAGGHKSKREAVSAALREYVQRRKQAAVLDLFDKVPYDSRYDYKAERESRRE